MVNKTRQSNSFLFIFCLSVFQLFAVGVSLSYSSDENVSTIEKENSIPHVTPYSVIDWLNYGDAPIVSLLSQAINDSSPMVRYTAAWSFQPYVLFNTVKSLPENKSLLPQIAAILLARLKHEKDHWTVEKILSVLGSISVFEREYEFELDQKIPEVLGTYALHANPFLRAAAIKGLGAWKDQPEYQQLIEAGFLDHIWMVRLASLVTNHNSQRFLLQALKDEDPNIRFQSFLSLKKFHKNKDVLRALSKLLWDPSGQVVFETIFFLAGTKDPTALKSLRDLYLAKENWRETIRRAIKEKTGEPVEVVLGSNLMYRQESKKIEPLILKRSIDLSIESFIKGQTYDRVSTILNLAWSNEQRAVEIILLGLEDNEPLVRYAATKALAINYLSPLRRTSEVLGVLLKQIQHPNSHVQRGAISAIAALKDVENQGRIEAVLHKFIKSGQDPFSKLAAVSELSRKTINERQILLKMSKDRFYEIRATAISSLVPMCTIEVIESLLELLQDPIEIVRLLAASKYSTSVFFFSKNSYPNLRHKVIEALAAVVEHDSSEVVKKAAKASLDTLNSHPHIRSERLSQYCS